MHTVVLTALHPNTIMWQTTFVTLNSAQNVSWANLQEKDGNTSEVKIHPDKRQQPAPAFLRWRHTLSGGFLLSPLSCCNLIISCDGIGGIFRWGPQWGLGMGVYVGPCFQGREASRGSAFLTQSTTEGMWTIWTKTSATMALHRPVHVVRRPAAALTLSAFSFPPGSGGSELDIHRLHRGSAVASSASAPGGSFLPTRPGRTGSLCEAHSDALRHWVDVKNAA